MSKEHAYAYEAGYRDGAINYELDHCPACKNVADLQEALDEIARLREVIRKYVKMPDEPLEIDERDFYVRAFIKWQIEEQPEVKRLKAENAKLRELVFVLAHCAADSGCDSCPINGGCARVGELDLCETVHDRMRELGVEP